MQTEQTQSSSSSSLATPTGANTQVITKGSDKSPWPQWARTADEWLTKFLCRNLMGMGPGDYAKTMEGRIIPMSESGVEFAYSERKFDLACKLSLSLVTSGILSKQVPYVSESWGRVDTIENIEKYGTCLGNEELFLTKKDVLDKLDLSTKTGIREAEKILGLHTGDLESQTLVRTTIDINRLYARKPLKGTDLFIPGGFTSGGAPEIVIDPINIFDSPAIQSIEFISRSGM